MFLIQAKNKTNCAENDYKVTKLQNYNFILLYFYTFII